MRRYRYEEIALKVETAPNSIAATYYMHIGHQSAMKKQIFVDYRICTFIHWSDIFDILMLDGVLIHMIRPFT